MARSTARKAVLSAFRWVDGHADIWRLFHDSVVFQRVVDELTGRVTEAAADKVAGIEGRGFILGGAVAVRAGLGFVPIRKQAGLFPGDKLTAQAEPDYQQQAHVLRIQRQSLPPGQRIMLVDDWAERGSQATAARQLIEQCGAVWSGLALIVDQLTDNQRAELAPVSSIVTAEELGPSS